MDAVTLLKENEQKDLLRLVTAGSVDDGKSTLIGRLLYESKGIFEDQLQSVHSASKRWGTTGDAPDLALLTDGLKAEREQGITIDVAYRFFATPRRKFIIADTPGHEQYTRNTATGASTANLAIILIDAEKGVLTQSRRHAFIASLLGIPHIVVAVNKMDLVDYSREVFETIRREFTAFAAKLQIQDMAFIPVSALVGDNVVSRSERTPWYEGRTLLGHLENVHIASDRNFIDFRLPVQYVLRPDRTFRGYLGTVASGTVRPGDEVLALPSGRRSRVKRVFGPGGEDLERGYPPQSVGVTLEDEIDISRGDVLVHPHNVPRVDRTLDAMVLAMSEQPLVCGREYLIKHLTRQVSGEITTLRYQVDVNTLHRDDEARELKLNEIGRCVLTLDRPIAHDPYHRNRQTGAFVLIDRVSHNTVGAGMILDREPSGSAVVPEEARRAPRSENVRLHRSSVDAESRAKRFGQRPCTLWLTGPTGAGKTTVAYELEKRLLEAGHATSVLDGENLRLTINKDLGFGADDRVENNRRCAEMAAALNEAGLIAICSMLSPYRQARQVAREAVGAERFLEIYLLAPPEVCRERAADLYQRADSGEVRQFSGVTAPYEPPEEPALILPTDQWDPAACADRLLKLLRDRGLIEAGQ
jgi:bifunctional enzyme CysN/CysC